jgi:hypothetical protein
MKYRLIIFLSLSALTVLMLNSGLTLAHHSATATYIQGKTIKIEGTLKEFIWRNPHSFIRVEARDDKGELAMWVIEGAAPAQLAESGLKATTFRPGDHVILTGQPGRIAEDHRLLLDTIERPSDGFKWKGPANQ